jgi:hypothetical protein
MARDSSGAASLILLALVAIALAPLPRTDAFAVGLRFNHTECFHKEIAHERAAGTDDGGASLGFTVVASYVVSKVGTRR